MSISTEIQRLQTAKADIKAAIENKGVTVGDGTIDTYADKINEISGGTDVIELTKYTTSFNFASTEGLPEELTVSFNYQTNFKDFWRNFDNYTVKHITLNVLKKPTLFARLFSKTIHTDVLEHITLNADTSSVTSFNQAFYTLKNLKIIDGTPLDLSSSEDTRLAFAYLSALKEVRFAENSIFTPLSFEHSPLLTATSVQSIIDGLADLTGGTTKTLTFHSSVGASLTDEQKAAITAKNWTLAY